MRPIWHSVDWHFRMKVADMKVVRWRCKIGYSDVLFLDYFVLHLRIGPLRVGSHVYVGLFVNKYVKK